MLFRRYIKYFDVVILVTSGICAQIDCLRRFVKSDLTALPLSYTGWSGQNKQNMTERQELVNQLVSRRPQPLYCCSTREVKDRSLQIYIESDMQLLTQSVSTHDSPTLTALSSSFHNINLSSNSCKQIPTEISKANMSSYSLCTRPAAVIVYMMLTILGLQR